MIRGACALMMLVAVVSAAEAPSACLPAAVRPLAPRAVNSEARPGPSQSVLYYREHRGRGNLKAYYTSDWTLRSENEK